MSKKNASAVLDATTTVKLADIDFDSIDETVETVEAPTVSETVVTALVPAETEEQVLSTVRDFDSEFKSDPLIEDYRKLAVKIKAEQDTTNKAIQYVGYGCDAYNISVKRKNMAPNAYDRAAETKTLETALLLQGVTDTMVHVQEIAGLFWLTKLDRSTPGGEGEPRSFQRDAVADSWFGGNLTFSTMRVLVKCIKRVSAKNEVDIYEYVPGFEPHVREWIIRLREGYLSMRQVEQLIKHRRTVIANEKTAARYAGLNPDEIASLEENEKSKTLKSKLAKLRTLTSAVQDYAATELLKGGADLRDFLVNEQIIPPIAFPSIPDIAAHLSPGDARALIHELVRQYATTPSRLNVFKAFYTVTTDIVAQMKSAKEGKPAAADLKKTG
jgi:hypothetical protein